MQQYKNSSPRSRLKPFIFCSCTKSSKFYRIFFFDFFFQLAKNYYRIIDFMILRCIVCNIDQLGSIIKQYSSFLPTVNNIDVADSCKTVIFYKRIGKTFCAVSYLLVMLSVCSVCAGKKNENNCSSFSLSDYLYLQQCTEAIIELCMDSIEHMVGCGILANRH